MATNLEDGREVEDGTSRLLDSLRRGLERAAVRVFWGLCAKLSPERAARLGRWLMVRLGPLSDRDRTVRRNLELAFPDRSRDEIRKLARDVWANAGIVTAEYPHLQEICDPDSGRVEVVCDPACDRGRAIVFCGPHLTSWEVSAVAPRREGWTMTVVYTPLPNAAINERLLHYRQRGLQVRLLPRDGSGRELMRALKRGEAIGLVADRREKGDGRVSFFGIERSISLAPALLALRTGAQFASAFVVRTGLARYRIHLEAPIEPQDPEASLEQQAASLMAQLYARYEQAIARQPGNWFCMKSAWPKPGIAETLMLRRATASEPELRP